MAKAFTVSLQNIIKETALETVYMPVDPAARLVSSCDVNRPGLALGGYFDYFDNDRIQILAGREYGLSFTSEKGVGTSARIVLPKTLKGA